MAVSLIGVAAGCSGSSHHHVADPFADGFPEARIAIDRVVCQVTPDNCERIVVLTPIRISQLQLIRNLEAYLGNKFGWRRTRYPQVVERDEGDVFDGRKGVAGGSVDSAAAELRFWHRTGFGQEMPPDKDELALLAAVRANPDGVVVTS